MKIREFILLAQTNLMNYNNFPDPDEERTSLARQALLNYFYDVVATLQILCAAGIVFRCILVIQKARENDASWREIFGQLKKFAFIGILCIVILEVVEKFGSYYNGM